MSRLGQVRASDGVRAVVRAGGRDLDAPLVALGDEAASVVPGDWLLLHTGLATRRLDPGAAAELLASLEETTGGPP